MLGTLINAGAIVLGSLMGFLLHSRLPKRIVDIVFQGIGLFTLFIGIAMSLKSTEYLLLIFSIVIGSIIGEYIDLDKLINRFGEFLKRKIKSKNEKFSEGLVTAFLLYCMGSMTILGAIEEGLGNKPDLLLAKSVLDGFSAIALTAAMGFGVMFSIIPLIIYQGGLSLMAMFIGDYFAPTIITELTAVGGLMLIGMGINILDIKKIKVLNMLPSLVIIVILASIFMK